MTKLVEVHCCVRNVRMLLAQQAFEVDAHVSLTYDTFIPGEPGERLGRACHESSVALLKCQPWYSAVIDSVPLFDLKNQRDCDAVGLDPAGAIIVIMHVSRRRRWELAAKSQLVAGAKVGEVGAAGSVSKSGSCDSERASDSQGGGQGGGQRGLADCSQTAEDNDVVEDDKPLLAEASAVSAPASESFAATPSDATTARAAGKMGEEEKTGVHAGSSQPGQSQRGATVRVRVIHRLMGTFSIEGCNRNLRLFPFGACLCQAPPKTSPPRRAPARPTFASAAAPCGQYHPCRIRIPLPRYLPPSFPPLNN